MPKTESKILTLKRLNPTRCSSRNDAFFALKFNFYDIIRTVTEIILTSNNKSEKNNAINLKKKMERFEMVFQIVMQREL